MPRRLMTITDDNILRWWAAGGYPLVSREAHRPKAWCRRERKRIFRERGYDAPDNASLERYRDDILKGRLAEHLA